MPTPCDVVSRAPAAVEWHAPSADAPARLAYKYPESPHEPVFDVRYCAASASASFKLRVPVGLERHSRKTTIFVHIYPDSIDRLEHVDSTEGGTWEPATRHGHLRHGFRFSLKHPPAIVAPKETSLKAKAGASANTMRLLHSLGHTRSLVLYFTTRSSSDDTLRALCVAAGGAGLTCLEDDYRLTRLYAGKGGEVLTGERLELLLSNDGGSSPPSYDELALSPPPPAKRRRTAESSGHKPSASSSIGIPPDMEGWKLSIEAKLNAVLDRTQDVEQRQKAQGEVMEQAQQAQAATAEDVCELRAEIRRMYDTFEERIGEVLGEVDQRVEDSTDDMRQECTDYTDVQIEERILDIKAEMREFVTEELNIQMEAVEANLKGSLSRANLAIEFDSD